LCWKLCFSQHNKRNHFVLLFLPIKYNNEHKRQSTIKETSKDSYKDNSIDWISLPTCCLFFGNETLRERASDVPIPSSTFDTIKSNSKSIFIDCCNTGRQKWHNIFQFKSVDQPIQIVLGFSTRTHTQTHEYLHFLISIAMMSDCL
jgi:hypothetical protein